MAIRSPYTAPVEIRPDIVHIHTPVHYVITQRVPMHGRGHLVSVEGEDYDATPPPPEPIPQPGGLDATFFVVGGSDIRDAEFRDLLSAPFFIAIGNSLNITVYDFQVYKTVSGDTNLNISVYTSIDHPEIGGDAHITDIEVE